MENNKLVFESKYKKLGCNTFDNQDLELINNNFFRPFIKVLLVPAHYIISVDFKIYDLDRPAVFFVNSNQFLTVVKASDTPAHLIYYNRDFYCVQIHDAEVACDGLLFNNLFEIPNVAFDESETVNVQQLFSQIKEEIGLKDSSSEELIRVYLKQVILKATREWKKQNLENGKVMLQPAEHDFFRNFSRLVEIHFREKHAVADYADLMNLAPKTLSHKFKKLNLENPNEIIKNRIILETKRLLYYTDLSVKEIAYQLGYEDPGYFNRMFAQKLGNTPANFRKEFKKQ